MRKEPSDTFSCRGVEDLRIEGVVGHHPMRIQIVAPRNGRSHTHTQHTNVYIIKLVMHVSHRLREAKKDKKVPPFLFFVIYFWQRNSSQQRSSLDVTDDGNRRQPMEGPSAYSVKIMWRWSLKFISVIIIYYMYVKEFDRSVGESRRQQNGRGKPQK